LKFNFHYDPYNFLAELIPIDIMIQNSDNCKVINGEIKIALIPDDEVNKGA